jgi:nucleotide-binding universal stress UspA family protein
MLSFNRILLASDFSAPAEAALHYAATLARQSHARLLILHVVDTRVTALPRWSDIFRSTEVFAALEADETKAFESLQAHPTLTGLTVERFLQHGNPTTHIIDMAPYADLVVMGTQGRSKEGEKALGKVARHVIHGCPTPILLVPEGGGNAGLPAVGVNHLSVQRILLALHSAQYAPQAIALSRALAAACNATLQVLQVIEPDKVASHPWAAGAGLYHNPDAVAVLVRKRLAEIVPDNPAGPRVERLVIEGNAADVILQQSTTHRADLVVMSAHAYGPLQRFFTLSTLEAVIERTPCPLLAVPFPHPAVSSTTLGNGFGNVD